MRRERGARIALLNRAARHEIENLVPQITKVETALAPRFQEHFVDAMAIPHKHAPYGKLRAVVPLPDTETNPKNSSAEPRRRGGRRHRRRTAHETTGTA